MDSKKIKFAKEFCFHAILEDAGNRIGAGLLDYQVPQDDLLIKLRDDVFVRVGIAAEKARVLEELHATYNRALLRADKVEGDYIYITLLEFSGRNVYDDENPMRIIVDQAIAADLRVNNIDQEKAVREIRKQLIVEENGRYAFAYSTNNKAKKLEMIGDRYSFVITRTHQQYLHITQIRKRSNRDRIDFPVMLLSGAIEITDELNDRARLTAKADEQYAKLVRSDTKFIDLWNIYNELELESIRQQAIELGYLKYKSFRYANGMILFSLEGGYTRREFCVDNMFYVAIANIDEERPMEYDFRNAVIIGTDIDYSCVNTTIFKIKEEMDTTRTIPSRGYLLPSISGSEIQNKRRKRAQQNILSNKCQLFGLKSIIQAGELVGAVERKKAPVSSRLEKEIFGDKERHFTEKQKLAIDAAINTPDIAVIQGPPGTGKTTVIKAIVKRLDELWAARVKILITSTQHDAVDNAVEEINYGGVPVNRVSVRRGKEDENLLIYEWIDQMIESCEKWLGTREDNFRSVVRGIFEKLVRVEETDDLKKKYMLLEECYQQMQPLDLSAELNCQYTKVLAELHAKINAAALQDENPLPALIRGQRFSKEAYLDDGRIQLKKLERFLKFESELEYEIPSYWKKLMGATRECPELERYLRMLRDDCDKLEAMCPETGNVADDLMQRDMKEIIEALRSEIVSRGDDRKTVLTNLIWEFKQELTNSSNVEELIRAYSRINAATCQQSANPHLSRSMGGFAEAYDFVIVDEAARSNPLDLLIPMSMGKKIILVGDHRQLPHMVERDIVKAVAKKSDDKNVEEVLEESLNP